MAPSRARHGPSFSPSGRPGGPTSVSRCRAERQQVSRYGSFHMPPRVGRGPCDFKLQPPQEAKATPMTIEPQWWIAAVEIPVIAGLFWMIHGLRADVQDRIERGDARDLDALARTRDELAEFRVEVARTYVPLSLIREVDGRLSGHLLRIEQKLEQVQRTALALRLPGEREP